MELGGRHFKWHQGSIEFHRIFHGIPWNSAAAKLNVTKFNGIPWKMEGTISNDTRVPWNSMEYSMEFHGICRRQIKCNKVPWKSMKLWDYNFNWHQVPLDFHSVFHETLELSDHMSPNLMEFHGTWWLLIQMKSGNKYFLTYIAEIMPANHAVGSIHIYSNRTMIWQISWRWLPTKDKTILLLRVIHYIDVIMTTIASQITSLAVVYSTVYSDVDQRKHQSSASLAFVWGIHRDRWIPRTKGQLRGKCFHLMTSSCFKKSHSD